MDGYLKESVSDAKEGMMRIASAEPYGRNDGGVLGGVAQGQVWQKRSGEGPPRAGQLSAGPAGS